MKNENMRDLISLEAGSGQALEVATLDVSVENYMSSLSGKAVKSLYQGASKFTVFTGKALYQGANSGLLAIQQEIKDSEAIHAVRVPAPAKDLGKAYSKLKYTKIFTPNKMDSTYPVLLDTIKSSLYVIEGLQPQVLAPLRDLLTKFLSTPEEMSKLYSIADSKVVLDTDKVIKVLQGLFSNTRGSTAMFPKAYSRMGDYSDSYVTLNEIISSLQEVDIQSVVDDTNQVVELVDLVFKRCGEQPETYVLSKSALKQLSELVFHTARSAELFGTIVSLIDEASQAMESNLDVVAKV